MLRGMGRRGRRRDAGRPRSEAIDGHEAGGAIMLSEQEATRITQVAGILGLAVGLLAVVA